MKLPIHPDRERILAELHARPFVPMETPQRVLHFAFQVDRAAADEDQIRIEATATHDGVFAPAKGNRHLSLDGGRLRWERHGEFVSYTVAVPLDAPGAWPDDLVVPGLLVAAVDLRLVDEEPQPGFKLLSPIVDDSARIATDFAANEAGFVEIIIVNGGMTDEVAGATVQRVLEIETYRCFALMGLPIAEKAALVMAGIEHALPPLMAKMVTAATLEDNRELLDHLTAMTLDLERSSAMTHFRFGATKAYAELVGLRIAALSERHDGGRAGLQSFFSRRFEPAIRTCATVSAREATLARKLTRAAQLLRTRVEVTLESQNRDLLETMGNRVQLQLRLQQTVEGFSIAAIAYYVASLLHLMISGLSSVHPAIDDELVTALSILPIVMLVAFAVARMRRHHQDVEPTRAKIAEPRLGRTADPNRCGDDVHPLLAMRGPPDTHDLSPGSASSISS